METYSSIPNLTEKNTKTVIALGTFDGIHLGHKAIINKAITEAKRLKALSVVLTFSNHPLSILSPQNSPLVITSQFEKEKIISSLGVDILINMPFTTDFLKITPYDFVKMVASLLQPQKIVVGPNYSFGYKGAGNPELLKKLGLEFDFSAEIFSPIQYDDHIVSSTLIRNLITEGNIDRANILLDRFFKVTGRVTHGDKRGKQIGFPTANINITEGLVVPMNGVYATKVNYCNEVFNAVTNVGVNPTFKGNDRRIEVHILDFDKNIYGQEIEVEFIGKIRSEKKFSGADELIAQIKKDLITAKRFY